MILQLHHQRIDNPRSTEMVAQGDPEEAGVNPDGLGEFIYNWLKDVSTRHPLSEGYQWMLCSEESDLFVRGRVIQK